MSDPAASGVSPHVDSLAPAPMAAPDRTVRRPPVPPLTDPTEVAVAAALERGDHHRALTLLMDRHGDSVYHYCRRMVGEERAADVHQHVFMDTFRGLPGFRGSSSARTWLFTIARKRCIDAGRAQGRRREREAPDTGEIDIVDPGPTADERLDASKRYAAIAACLDELAPAARTAVLLRYQEELPYEELATMLEEPANTIGRRVARAVAALGKCVERRMGGVR